MTVIGTRRNRNGLDELARHQNEEAGNGNGLSLFRRIQQRVSFRNRWKKRGVKFDPKFHFIIGQLIIKDIVKADGKMYPDAAPRSSSKKSKSKSKKSSQKSKNTSSKSNFSSSSKVPKSKSSTPSTPSSSCASSSPRTTAGRTTGSKPTSSSRKKRYSTNETERLLSSQRCLDCTERCPICWEGYKVGEKVCWSKNKNCNHAYHFDCIVTWLVDNDHCPMCRSPYLTKEKDKEKEERSGSSRSTAARSSGSTATRSSGSTATRRRDHPTSRPTRRHTSSTTARRRNN